MNKNMLQRASLCEWAHLVGPYHDDELDEPRSATLREHLLDCHECAEHLSGLRRISGAIGSITLEPISEIERIRMYRLADQIPRKEAERAMIRLAGGLAALAASLLIVTSIWLMGTGSQTQIASAQPLSVSVAMLGLPHANAAWADGSGRDQANSYLSHWMVRNLGGENLGGDLP